MVEKLIFDSCVIAATAIFLDAVIVTTDSHFFDCQYPALRVMPR
jgi:predicted nucleic acid-binding protein